MAKNPSREQSRVPPPYRGLQVNFCKNVNCHHFGKPASTEKQPRGPGANSRPNDGYIVGSKRGFRARLTCKSCGQYTVLKSNKGVYEEYSRLSAYLQDVWTIQGCKNPECSNHKIDVSSGKAHYQRFGTTESGAIRYRCKACHKTFSVSQKPTSRQKTTHKNKAIFRLLVNKVPFKRICEVHEISAPTLYRKIDFLHAQCLAFAANRERHLEHIEIPRLYISSDRQEFTINWTNTRDKRNVILKAITSVDTDTGYVFGMHTNFDPGLDPLEIARDACVNGDYERSMPFRKYARLWLTSDYAQMIPDDNIHKRNGPIPEGGLLRDIEARYAEALKRDEIEASDDPEVHIKLPQKGMQVHEEYTLYGHFLFLRRLFANVGKVRFFLDQDSGMRAACFAAFRDEILAERCDAFYVRINKDLTLHQKQRLIKVVERDLEEAHARYPYLSTTSIRLLRIMDEMKRLETIGKWEDRWLNYPFPDMSEPEKAVCHLTPHESYSESQLAHLYLKASLHAVDSYFNQVRTRLSPLQRAGRSPSSAGRTWYGYQLYRPELVQKLLDILRVFHNYCLRSKKDKQTPAMRLGLARGPVDLDKIISFPKENRELANGEG